MTTFAERLKYAMEQANMSQSALSEQAGASKAAISQYLSGKNTPGPDRIKALADATGVSFDYLMGYGAAGVELKAGVSCASPLPLGTVVEVEGLGEYIVQDRPAQWVIDKYGENQIDIYFDNHEAASAFGLKQLNVYLKGEPEK